MQLNKITEPLSRVQGVKAIALGGSQSRNEADQNSDYDIGVYYEDNTLDLPALSQALTGFDDGHKENLLHAPGEWGPWINGGAWLTVDYKPVDILLREIGKVEAVVTDCMEGRITIDYQCGHPFGFVNLIYAGETHYCKPLWQDGSGALDALKALLHSKGDYSPRMREAVIRKFVWEAWFSLGCGRKAAFKGDLNYAAGSVFRAVCSWVEVLYAFNSIYLMNEKGALPRTKNLKDRPDNMDDRIKQVYSLLAAGCAEEAYVILDALHHEIEVLTADVQRVETIIR